MKTRLSVALTCLLISLGAFLSTGCRSGSSHSAQARPLPPIPLVLVLDVNRDGIIDANEIATASSSLLTLDLNADGKLTPDEYLPPPRTDGSTRPVPPIVLALDTNGDGVIDAAEIANAPAALRTLDKQGDGRLTMLEVMGPPEYEDNTHPNYNQLRLPSAPGPVGGGGNNPIFGSPAPVPH